MSRLIVSTVSAWLHGERITPAFAVGSVLVLVGVYIGAIRGPNLPPSPHVMYRRL
jgi:drug/metabolite transporter (DMT)-like permease